MCSRETICARVMLARSGNIGWFSSSGPKRCEVVGVDVVDPEDRVRIAHVHDRRRMQHRLVDRPDLQLDRAGVAELLRQRNLVPGKARLPHVDGEFAVRHCAEQLSSPALVSKVSRSLPVSSRNQRGDATHAVAAGARFRAVIVVDADEGIGAGGPRRIERHQLVVGRALGAGRRPRLVGADLASLFLCRHAYRQRRFRCRCRSSSRRRGRLKRSFHPA